MKFETKRTTGSLTDQWKVLHPVSSSRTNFIIVTLPEVIFTRVVLYSVDVCFPSKDEDPTSLKQGKKENRVKTNDKSGSFHISQQLYNY